MSFLETGGLFFFANNILQYYSKENVDTTRFLTALSLFFQINDDYQNLCSDYVSCYFCLIVKYVRYCLL